MLFWKRFDKVKPKKSGWYLCTIDTGSQRYTMDLYWDAKHERFKDNRRLNVFQLYEVYGYGYASDNPDPYLERMYKDNLCDRTDEVVAWRNCPKAYMKGFKPAKPVWEEEEENELGYCKGYIADPCPKCGRVRVEAWSCGKHICEKCHWCIEDGTYYLED